MIGFGTSWASWELDSLLICFPDTLQNQVSTNSAFYYSHKLQQHVTSRSNLNTIIIILIATQGFSVSLYAVATTIEGYTRGRRRDSWSSRTIIQALAITLLGATFVVHWTPFIFPTIILSSTNSSLAVSIIGCIVSLANIVSQEKSTTRGIFHIVLLSTWVIFIAQDLLEITQSWSILSILCTIFLLDLIAPHSVAKGTHIALPEIPLFSFLIFSWVGSLFQNDGSGSLQLEDLWRFETLFTEASQRRRHLSPSIFGFFWSFFAKDLILSSILEFINTVTKLVQPWLLRALLQAPTVNIVTVFCCTRILSSISANHSLFYLYRVSAKSKVMFSNRIFEKALQLDRLSRSADVQPANLVEIDGQKVAHFALQLNLMWSGPLQCLVSIGSLVYLLSWQSVLAGSLFMILSYPGLLFITSHFGSVMQSLMKNKDIRTSLVTETLRGISTIKLNCWESTFICEIQKARDSELSALRKLAGLQVAIIGYLAFVPQGTAFIILCLVSYQGHGSLNSATIFPALVFLTVLRDSFQAFPDIISAIYSSSISYQRIMDFISLKDRAMRPLTYTDLVGLSFDEASFASSAVEKPYLSQINLLISTAQIAAITGPTGSGKTSLLESLLNDFPLSSGTVQLSGRVAYMPQTPSLFSGTIRSNILLGHPFDPRWYEIVVTGCALVRDLESFVQGDFTIISGSNSGLSGGQKSRIALARAVYSKAEIYLLDDPLAALDVGVQKHVMDMVLGPSGLLQDTIRLVATSTPALLVIANTVYHIDSGNFKEVSKTPLSSPESDVQLSKEPEVMIVEAHLDLDATSHFHDRDSEVQATEMMVADSDLELGVGNPPATPDLVLISEQVMEGTVSRRVYMAWLGLAPVSGWFVVAILSICTRFVQVASTYCLKLLTETEGAPVTIYLVAFSVLVTLQAIFTAGFISAMFYLCLIPAARKIHGQLVSGIIFSPKRFSDTNPLGHLLNRFTKDVSKVDGTLASSALNMIVAISNISMVCIVILSAIPISAAFLIPCSIAYFIVQEKYLQVARHVRRLELGSKGPIMTNIQEYWSGANTIHAFDSKEFFLDRSRKSLRMNLNASITERCLEIWLKLRLEAIAIVVQTLSASLLVSMRTKPGTFGIVMNYVLQITVILEVLVRSRVNLEIDMVSVERILEFAHSEPETKNDASHAPIAASWPTSGGIVLKNISATYGDINSPCLRDLSLEIESGERVAIVGRTGAGKSSLGLALTRMIEPFQGTITIDGIDISKIDLRSLRSRITTISQEPWAFNGTLRRNLDPENVHEDSELLDALLESHLLNTGSFGSLSESEILEQLLGSDGVVLSAGQLQLMSIARAILQNNKILILDEATASVDAETDAIVQALLRSERFLGCTFVTIAHRLGSVLDYDRIIVLEGGEVVEDGSPEKLAQNGGNFASMLGEKM